MKLQLFRPQTAESLSCCFAPFCKSNPNFRKKGIPPQDSGRMWSLASTSWLTMSYNYRDITMNHSRPCHQGPPHCRIHPTTIGCIFAGEVHDSTQEHAYLRTDPASQLSWKLSRNLRSVWENVEMDIFPNYNGHFHRVVLNSSFSELGAWMLDLADIAASEEAQTFVPGGGGGGSGGPWRYGAWDLKKDFMEKWIARLA